MYITKWIYVSARSATSGPTEPTPWPSPPSISNKLVFCYYNIRSLQKLRDGSGRPSAVEHGWMDREVDSEDEEQ